MAYTIESRGIWTDERKAFVKELWQDGKSATEISKRCASEFGIKVSRNAVIGIIHRMGAQGRGRPAAPTKAPKSRANANGLRNARARALTAAGPRPALKVIGGTVFVEGEARQPRETLRARPWDALEGSNPVPLMDRARGTCRWPIDLDGDEHHVCGLGAEDDRYCPAHADMSRGATPKTPNEMMRFLRRVAA